jgi:hypothetical protein
MRKRFSRGQDDELFLRSPHTMSVPSEQAPIAKTEANATTDTQLRPVVVPLIELRPICPSRTAS